MQTEQTLAAWVEETIGSDSWRTVAEKLHTTHSTIQRRLRNGEADAVVEIATAYSANPVPGLIAAGSITKMDVLAFAGTYSVEDLSDTELAQIIVDRLQEREARESESQGSTLHAVPTPELAASYYPEDAVADESPEEGDGLPDDYEP